MRLDAVQQQLNWLLAGILAAWVLPCQATEWLVGPNKMYSMPSQVAALVQDGDTISIDAGVYWGDVAYWGKNNLLLRGVGGMAHLQSGGLSYGNKAIWVIGGNNVTVEYIEFSECTSTDKNGGGIRAEGKNLTVRYCSFHHNETGILAASVSPSTIVIEYCEFGYNGHVNGYAHNCYINQIDTLIFRYNYVHHAVVGHELKSRAHVNFILYNRFSNEDGNASREIDLPNAGMALLIGNIFQQGINATNSGMLGYGLEGMTAPVPHELYLINNTFINDKNSGTFVHIQSGSSLLKIYNNMFVGGGTLIVGYAAVIDSSHNWKVASLSSAGFADPLAYDYRLTGGSPAIDAGIDPGTASNGMVLLPQYEYVHPHGKKERITYGAPDLGAHEYEWPQYVEGMGSDLSAIRLYTCGCAVAVQGPNASGMLLRVYDLSGLFVAQARLLGAWHTVQLPRTERKGFLICMTEPTGKTICRKALLSCTR
ncbi:MAG: right-handed parallel beta-helix repeat-containing protein [Chitinophagales bacterium]|nr:right-handed parallel beta-helix repeat-containing protein [Chitinophagales bacterium]MDW8427999.1 right-handed parallel beta-helix repeat-containing protein [Chitinophagales bacterium]